MTVRYWLRAIALAPRVVSAAVLIGIPLAAGCVRHATVQDGLTVPITRRSPPTPDESLRTIFQRQQTSGGFNPLADNGRVLALENRLKDNPADIDARLELAGLYESYRLYSEALEQYTQAFGNGRSEKALLGIVRCEQALNRSWQAIPPVEQWLKETPSAVVWNALAILHNVSGNLGAGENALREAVAAEPLSDQWHNNLGYNLLLQNKTDDAEGELRKALELNPKSVTTHNNLGMLLARRGDLQAAFEEFRFSVDAATAHNNVAVVLMEMGKFEESRDQLLKALAVRRYFGPAMSNFKLVQEQIRQRSEQQKTGSLKDSDVRVTSAQQ